MKQVLKDRLQRLEFTIGAERVPAGMPALYERWVQLGLGEIEPKRDHRGFPWQETGVAWYYRRMMEDLHAAGRIPKDDFEHDMLARYQARLSAGLIQPFDFPDEMDALEADNEI